MKTRHPILKEMRRTRLRIQGERFLRGLALTALVVLLASVVTGYVLSRHNFSDEAIFWARLFGGLASLACLLGWVLMPLVRRPSVRAVARFLEERRPQLKDRLATAVEGLEEGSKFHAGVQSLLLRDAGRQLASGPGSTFYYPQMSLLSLLGIGASVALFCGLFLSGPAEYRYSLNKLLGWADSSRDHFYSISVQPGDAQVVRHADLEIAAVLEGFASDEVFLVAKYESQSDWERVRMRASEDGPSHLFLFFDVREGIQYYCEAEGIRSDTFTVDVSEAPAISALELRLRFPSHTGLQETVQTDDGDIRALTGTQVRVRITADQPVRAGSITFENSEEMTLDLLAPDRLEGAFTIEGDDFYRIRLQNTEGVWNAASDEYVITALQDQPPSLSITEPGRDRKVTNLEEVFVQVEAEDDYGIRDLKLSYSINGESEKVVPLQMARYPRQATSSTTFYLEDFDLVPGDFVSYYATARDANSEAVSDIFFLEVLPYDREYSQSQQKGGGSGEDLRLAKFQKEVIAATFNVLRDRQAVEEDQLAEDIQTVAQMQDQLRQQAVSIKERIERRGALAENPEFKQMTAYLGEAINHMGEAHGELKNARLSEALTPEQKAYQKLLRSEALFREIQIAMSSGGSSSEASVEELADLVDLELDRTKNQYETLQQNRSEERQEQLEELSSRLKELARRQQQELERRRRLGTPGSSGGSSTQQFVEELEEMARRLEKLSRNRRDQQLNDISRELKQAARDLKQSQSGQGREAQGALEKAMERLQRARESLNRERKADVAEQMRGLSNEAGRLLESQREVVDKMRDLESREASKDQDWFREAMGLARSKEELQNDLLELEGDLHRLAKSIEPGEEEAARQLKRAGLAVRDNRVAEKMQEGTELLLRQWTMMARRREEGVQENIEQLVEEIEKAGKMLGSSSGNSSQEKSAEALRRLGDLVDNLESLGQRAADQRPDSDDPAASASSSPSRDRGSPDQGSQPDGQSQTQEGEASRQSGGSRKNGESSLPGQAASGANQQGARTNPENHANRQPNMQPSPGRQGSTGQFNIAAGSTGIDPRQLGREWQERVRDAEGISELMRQIDPARARDIAALAKEMRRLDEKRVFRDAESLRKLRSQIIDGFKEVELGLFRQLSETEADQFRLTFEEEVPAGYRSRVEEYYQKLAEETVSP